MRGFITKILLLVMLVIFFVVRPFIIYGSPVIEHFSATNNDYLLAKPSLKKQEEVNYTTATHVSACDDSSFRKICLDNQIKITSFLQNTFIIIAVLMSVLSCLTLNRKRTLLQIISSQQYFYSLSTLRI